MVEGAYTSLHLFQVNVVWQLIKQYMNGFTGVILWNSAIILRVCFSKTKQRNRLSFST